MVLNFYQYCLPCQLVHRVTGKTLTVWLKSETFHYRHWVAATRKYFPGWRFDRVIDWEATASSI
jgi:hypothetical protein